MKKIVIFLIMVVVMAQAKTYRYTNELINEESPYLLQHAHNPVNWMPWGKKAFEMAKKEHKLIFLSIGYSTCHWCHVMEEESFEDEEVAKILNENYISIKVDREEMPSLDKHFQDVFYLMNKRGGGWPLTIILTPDAKPFFSATYIPKEPKYGNPGLINILKYFVNLKKSDYEKIQNSANEIERYLKLMEQNKNTKAQIPLDDNIVRKFVEGVAKNYDEENGGIGVSPKFPHASTIKVLLQIYRLNGDKKALDMAKRMLEAMAKGGIYDQIEGGFFRYSTDERWMIPHFEKMLYTNAELLEDYALAYKITKKSLYKKIVEELVSFLRKRFENEGVFYSASDADSIDKKSGKKEEGAYFVYSYKEAKEALINRGLKNYRQILNYLGITKEGNFERKNNPYIDEYHKKPSNLKEAKEALMSIREKRAYPFIDKKILTSWNALLVRSLFEASDIDRSLLKYAKRSLEALLEKVYVDKKLYHQVLLGKKPKIEANLEDYSFVISSLISAYEKTFDMSYLDKAKIFTNDAISKFYIDKTWQSSLAPFKQRATFEGNAYVSSLGVMVENLLKLAVLEESLSYQELAKSTIEKNSMLISKYPSNFPQAILDIAALKRGYIVIKSKKNKLKSFTDMAYKKLSYPFILYKATLDEIYLACRVDTCFAYSDNLEEMIKKLKSIIR